MEFLRCPSEGSSYVDVPALLKVLQHVSVCMRVTYLAAVCDACLLTDFVSLAFY